jgi:hypothetical protein
MLLYYAERTLAYGKRADASSLSQIINGIFSRRKQEWIRGPAGLGATAVKKANKLLSEKGFLIRRSAIPGQARYRPEQGNEATEYEISWTALYSEFEKRRKAPLGHVVTKPPGRQATKPLGRIVTNNRGKSSSEEISNRSRDVRNQSGVGRESPPTALATSAKLTKRQVPADNARATDDDENPAAPKTLRSLQEEVAHWCEKRNQLLSDHEWREIRDQAEVNGIDLEKFLAFVLPHLRNPKTRNPIGMIKSKLKAYRAMNRPASQTVLSEPVTGSAEKCPICKEVKGKGMKSEGGRVVPCECADAETRAKVEKVNKRDEEARLRKPTSPSN